MRLAAFLIISILALANEIQQVKTPVQGRFAHELIACYSMLKQAMLICLQIIKL
jgi:hypothetical protein